MPGSEAAAAALGHPGAGAGDTQSAPPPDHWLPAGREQGRASQLTGSFQVAEPVLGAQASGSSGTHTFVVLRCGHVHTLYGQRDCLKMRAVPWFTSK